MKRLGVERDRWVQYHSLIRMLIALVDICVLMCVCVCVCVCVCCVCVCVCVHVYM